MGIAPKFSAADVHKIVEAKMQGVTAQIEAKLTRVGNKFVADARLKADNDEYGEALRGISKTTGINKAIIDGDTPSFTDRTGNLRSSIGFIIMKDGDELKSDFEQTLDGASGKTKAISYAKEVGGQYKGSYTLVVVAGMEYAAAVESLGYDVMTGSSIQATENLNKYFKRK